MLDVSGLRRFLEAGEGSRPPTHTVTILSHWKRSSSKHGNAGPRLDVGGSQGASFPSSLPTSALEKATLLTPARRGVSGEAAVVRSDPATEAELSATAAQAGSSRRRGGRRRRRRSRDGPERGPLTCHARGGTHRPHLCHLRGRRPLPWPLPPVAVPHSPTRPPRHQGAQGARGSRGPETLPISARPPPRPGAASRRSRAEGWARA